MLIEDYQVEGVTSYLCDICEKQLGGIKNDLVQHFERRVYTLCKDCKEELKRLIELKKKLK